MDVPPSTRPCDGEIDVTVTCATARNSGGAVPTPSKVELSAPLLVTVMPCTPATKAGVWTCSCVDDSQRAGTLATSSPSRQKPTATCSVLAKPKPLMTMCVPPSSGPITVDTSNTRGTASYVNSAPVTVNCTSSDALIHSCTVVAASAGGVTHSALVPSAATFVATTLPRSPKRHMTPGPRCSPARVIVVPPLVGPVCGVTDSTRRAGVNSNDSACSEKSTPLHDTRSSTSPTADTGVAQRTSEALMRTAGDSKWPNKHVMRPPSTKLVPRIVTTVPPVSGPTSGYDSSSSTPASTVKGTVVMECCWPLLETAMCATVGSCAGESQVRLSAESHRACTTSASLLSAYSKRHTRSPELTKPAPAIVMDVPPTSGPNDGVAVATRGVGWYVNVAPDVDTSAPFSVTCTRTTLAVPTAAPCAAGTSHSISVSETTTAGVSCALPPTLNRHCASPSVSSK
mmetsp:Transcript_8634/g.30626  ORF Transcript_8634/g.30626 Transcript_8634/m.30626 type:complete len:456 (+) Transcript_8634:2666-4033(+)